MITKNSLHCDIEDRVTTIIDMIISNCFFTTIGDEDGSIIVDDDGNAVLADWKYKEV